MDEKSQRLQDALLALEIKFTEKLPSKLLEIEQALTQFVADSKDMQALILLHRLLHTMAGSAGTFGFDELGAQARTLESRLKTLLAGANWSAPELEQFSKDAHTYISTAQHSAKSMDLAESQDEPNESDADVAVEPLALRLIYLVDEDPAQAAEITLQLEHFGYEVLLLQQRQALIDALHARAPDVLVIDLGLSEEHYAGVDEVARLKQSGYLACPIIFTSNSSSYASRLSAVRAGGDGYFTKPIDIVALTERIDALCARRQSKGYRVLVIDDDVMTAEYYAAVLRDAGMEIQLLREPGELLNAMADFRPELLLMDVYMPECNGVELSKMIRQDNTYLDVPIVFLSSEDDLQKQLDAVEAGADDFLTKPIVPRFLVSALSSRAERYRALRTLIMRDGLTGLYNHTAIKEELMAEIAIAGRNHTPLALAMLDLDNFKSVNDTYGHPVGDQVLRTLSRLLRQRLRRSDVVGRYGGEEFAVIFPGTSAATAAKVLDQVRQVFCKIQQFSEFGDFSSSFSAGIADLAPTSNFDELFDSADAALYSAKHSGKNCIVLAES